MIRVQPQPEPQSFDVSVRHPGRRFLRSHPHPTGEQWKRASFWRACLSDLYEAYEGVCAYCAEWIPLTTGEASVDHFVPKSLRPPWAYEWHNLRLAARYYNTLKGEATSVLDPFALGPDWFVLDVPSLQLRPNDALNADEATQVWETIGVMQLNGERAIHSRSRWIRDYCSDSISYEYMKRNAPFIAYELERQGLRQSIKAIVGKAMG